MFAIAPKLDRLTLRPVPSPDRQPHLPPHLIAAERALKELAPGGPAAAGLLSDGIWQAPGADPVAKPSLDGTRAGAEAPPDDGSCDASSGEVGSCDAPSGENATPSPEMTRADEKQTNLKKYEEYFLRYQLTDRMVKSAAKPDENFRDRKFVWDGADHPTSTGISERRPASDADADTETQSVESYQAEIDSDGGGSSSDQVAKKSDGTSGAEAVDAYAAAEASMLAEVDGDGSSSDGSTSIVPSSPIEEEINGADDAAKEMMTQLRKEARAYVNPQTGKSLRWGDTWRHAWGGGVGVGRPESRPRRFAADGTTMIMPAATDKGYALVPTSSDKRALEEFYDECNGIRWSVQRNWGVGEPCANNWHGVVCTGGRVTQLNMNLNNVACWGELNLTALAKLDELLYLDMSDNLFSGEIPDELFSMTKLQTLALSSNRMTGKLSKKFGRLKNLRHLDLSANGFHGALPKEMGKMKSLEVLYLGEEGLEVKNKFTGKIPEAWVGMKSLQRLSLTGNSGVKGKFPTWIGKLQNLEELTLSNTGLLGEIPESIDQCYNLRTLDLSNNGLTGAIPEGITRLGRLKHLKLRGNKLEGGVPPGIAELRELESLDLGSNKLTGQLPEKFEGLTKLEYLDVSRNNLSGELPKVLPRIPSLRAALLYDNSFEGQIPGDYFTKLPLLMHLYLDRNKLEGALPGEAMATAKMLKEFHASFNKISGEIPKDIGRLPRLASLQLRRNQLVGEIPPELGDCPELARLDLSENKLSGRIPAALANATDLAEIRLGVNRLDGPIPNELESLELLRALVVNNNKLTGPIPPWLGTHPCLRDSDLSGNRFHGRLPETLWDPNGDDGEGGVGRVPFLPARHDRSAGYEERNINLGLNPLFCPLPDWADEVHATCRQAEIKAISPSNGPSAGGTLVTVTGSNLGAGDEDSGCLFGKEKDSVWVPAVEASDSKLVCESPPKHPENHKNAVVLRVGHKGEAITRFGELFRYT